MTAANKPSVFIAAGSFGQQVPSISSVCAGAGSCISLQSASLPGYRVVEARWEYAAMMA